MKIRVKNKQNKNGWIFFKFAEQVDGFIFKCVHFIWRYKL